MNSSGGASLQQGARQVLFFQWGLFRSTKERVLQKSIVILHLLVASTTSNKESTNVLKQSPEDRNVENNSDICDFVSSIVIDCFLVHHKIKTLELTHKLGTLSKIQSSQNQWVIEQ